MIVPQAKRMKTGEFRIQLRLGGNSTYIYGRTENECKRKAAAYKAKYLADYELMQRCGLTTAQAIDRYIVAHPKLSPSTVRGYISIRDNVFKDAKDVNIHAVDWQRTIDADSHAPKTIVNAWRFIKAVMVYNRIQPPTVVLPKLPNKERTFLDETQLRAFLKAVEGHRCEIAALLGLHSLRRSEILDLEWKDIDLAQNIIHVRGAAVLDKNGKLIHKAQNKNPSSTRDVPIMIPRLRELLKDGGQGYIITAYPNSMYKEINRICEKAGLPLVGVHGLRHSFVSLAYHLGWSEIATMKVAGYADYSTMRKIYTHIAQADAVKNIGAMTDFFSNQ